MSRKQNSGHVPRVYLEQPLAAGAQLELSGDRFHHLHNVLRLGVGASLVVFNGNGGEFSAHLVHLARRGLTLECGPRQDPVRESSLHIVLGQATARGDRMDYAIAKAVELGVVVIQPLLTERAKVRLNHERSHKKQTHWQRVAVSAAEQCGRTVVPEIREPCRLTEWLDHPPAATGLVLDPDSTRSLAGAGTPSTSDIALLVGPESGLTASEVEQANNAGFASINLGPRVLRTETAGIACLAAMQTLWGDLG